MSHPEGGPAEEPARRRNPLADLTPLRASPAFARLWAGQAISGIGSQMTIVAVGLDIYRLTESTLAVSGVALFALLPMIVAGLWGGMLADFFDRRRVALIAAVVAWLSTATLAVLAWTSADSVPALYALATLNAVAATVIQTTRAAIYPRILPRELLPAAAALNGITIGIMVTVGPALAGVLVATVGFGWTYTIDVVLFVSAFVGILGLPRILPEGDVRRPGLDSLRQGFSFLRHAPNIRASFLIDIGAMTFGQPRVLFPAIGVLVLGGGAITVGLLTAAFAVGAFLASVFSGRLGGVRWQGRAIARAVQSYGVFVALFGLVVLIASFAGTPPSDQLSDANVPALVLAALAMTGAGASDEVSAIFRSTMLQTAVPDHMRGRLQGVFTVVVAGGPRIGDLYVGALSVFVALWFPPLFGGVVIVVIAALIARFVRSFRAYDSLNPVP
ncbi:MFS transporter [Herbiconiux moechotypicola]|uniref:MFS transporter n=1 Tax=Herbiconiux moechotypicola TaxID=637393 RepID=A0ABN3D7M0_9MICO|nr:MFS transporter [Herbiconiux moechotypicola]MCS5728475.1 MFS transporter [Herbiconiux moechotypicola]